MSDLFLKIVNMSISASWLVLAVLLLRFILKKAPKWVNVLLWGIVAVRLAFPFSIESALSLIPSAETISPGIMMDTVPSVQTGVPAINSVINPVIGSSLAPAPGDSANPLQIWIPILSFVWVVGVVTLLLYTVVSYWRLRRKVSEAVILRDNIFQSENVASPFVLGVFRPRIYLPYNMDEQDLSHVVAHEQAHIRRRDHWWKPLGFLLLTIHWFNPLMWLAYVLLCRDIELACDEKVIKELGNEQRADYTQALVACSVNRRMIAACPLAFGEVGVKERVKSVMNYKKPAFWVVVLAVIACIVVAVCFLTNPMGFQFDEATHTIVSANHFDMRNTGEAVAVEMNLAQISELSSRLAGVKNTKKSGEYGGFTPGYQISALLEDGTYIRISGYSLSDNDMVDIEWNGERYLVSDEEFQDYLSRICAGGDVSSADNAVAGKTYLYEGQGIMGSFTITLYDDGSFTYYEGMASSYIGVGSWEQDGDTITMTDDGHGGYGFVNHFRLDGDDLVFVDKDSANFVYVKVKDGEKFHHTGEAFKQNNNTDGSVQIMPSQKLSLNDVIMLSQKGYELSWSDFEQFKYIETGSGLYIRVYEINEMYELWIGGSWIDEDPMYIYLALTDDLDTRIDIRDGGVTEFISEYGNLAPAYHPEGILHLGLNAEIIEIDTSNHILYVKDIDESADVFGDRCAIDCNYAISRFNLLYVNYGDANDVRTIGFNDFQVGDAVIIGLYDSEKEKALNGAAVAEQVQLGTQRMNQSSTANMTNDEDPGLQYYLTVGAEGVKSIELSMPHSSGGCENADGSLFKKGERIWLENLDGYSDLRGLTITALGENGEIIWTASIPDNDENEGFTHLTQDGWTLALGEITFVIQDAEE